MKILVLSQMYPSIYDPHFGVFIKREVESLSSFCKQKVVVPYPLFKHKAFGGEKLFVSCSKSGLKKRDVIFQPYIPMPGRLFLPIKGFWFFVFTCNTVYCLKRLFNFDIIQAHKVFPEGFCAVLFKKLLKRKVVVSIRGADINELPKQPILRKMISYTLQNSDTVITVSKSLKNRVLELGVSGEKVQVMPKGVDLALFSPREKSVAREKLMLPKDKIIILSVGWLIPRKNPFAFIHTALNIPKHERAKYLFVMVGEGPLRSSLEEKIREEGIEHMFRLVGRAEPKQVPLWMNAADIFVLVSFAEGMPNVLYESMACGCAIVASCVDGAAEIIQDGKNGVLVSPSDYQRISDTIIALAMNEKKCETLGRNARDYMQKHEMSWEKNALWVVDKYKSLLGQ